MLDLSTRYLGFKLPHPLIVGASPLADTLDGIRRIEDAGASAVVLRSLFEEQISAESIALHRATDAFADSHGEAMSYFPASDEFALGPDEYLEHVRAAKAALTIPVIASLNGGTLGRWLEYARLIEQAGADAVELNVFLVPTNADESGAVVERRTVEMVAAVRRSVRIPVAVKLAPFYTALAHFAAQLDDAGANSLVLFNRFYEPDVDIERLEHEPKLHLSSSTELPLRLRWLAILSGHVRASLAATGGVHSAQDAIKAIMCGAHAVQLVSVLLRGGLARIRALLTEIRTWLHDREYESLAQAQGSMNLARCPDPSALARGNYIHMLQTWHA